MPAEALNMPTSPTWFGGVPRPQAASGTKRRDPQTPGFAGVTVGLRKPLPWEETGPNPALAPFMLPGSAEWSPNAVKERSKVIVGLTPAPEGPASGQGGSYGGGGGSGGKSGGGGVSYMPGGSPIGKGKPKAWSAPQQNFEDAKGKGALTPEQIKQAQDFAAAHGRTFDPTLGYSTNVKPSAPAIPQGQASAPSPAVGVPAVPPKPAANAPTPGGGDAFPHVFDGGKPVLTQSAKDKGITGWDENGAPIYGFADGTPPGGMPLRALEGRTFWTGEQGPELQQIKDGKLTVIPTQGTQTMEDRQSWSPVFAPTSGPVLRTAPSADRVVATPATPQTFVPQGSAPAPQGFTPAFSPTFAPTLSAPPGVRQTDFRRFLRTPQGMQYALGHEAQNQGMAAHNQSRAAAMNTERQWQMEDKSAAKAERDAKDKEDEASIDSIIGSLSGSETTLDPVWRDIVKSAKGAKGKQAALDLAIRHAMDKDAEKRRSEREDRQSVQGVTMVPSDDGSGAVPVATLKGGGTRMAGGFVRTKAQGQAGIKILPIPGTKHGVPYYDDGSGNPPRPLAGGHVFEGDEQSGWKLLNADKPQAAPTIRNAGTASAPNMQQWDGSAGKWVPFNPPGAPKPPDDAEKVKWMGANGYKPDKSGQYPADAWTRAYKALMGQQSSAGATGEDIYFDRIK